MVDATTAALLNGQSKAQTSQTNLNEDFDQFLRLLTTQLQNQDPLEPMDSAEFTQQLVMFSQVEQQIQGNQYLESLILATNQNSQVQALGYIGQEVQYVGSSTGVLQNGELKIRYATKEPAAEMTIQFVDSTGKIVRTIKTDPADGPTDFVWDGKDDNGQQLDDGIYTVKVAATNGQDATVDTVLGIYGTVNGVNSTGDEITLSIGDYVLGLDNVIKVMEKKPQTQPSI